MGKKSIHKHKMPSMKNKSRCCGGGQPLLTHRSKRSHADPPDLLVLQRRISTIGCLINRWTATRAVGVFDNAGHVLAGSAGVSWEHKTKIIPADSSLCNAAQQIEPATLVPQFIFIIIYWSSAKSHCCCPLCHTILDLRMANKMSRYQRDVEFKIQTV